MAEIPNTSPSLLARLRNPDDGRAWAEFTEIYTPLVRGVALRKGLQDADADDLTQDVFCAVAAAIERQAFDPALGSFRGWLFRIARNLVVNFLIRRQRHPRGSGGNDMIGVLEAQPAPDAEESALFDAEYRRRLLHWAAEQVRGEFTDLAWKAFWQAGVEGRSAREVADALGTTVGTVYHYKSRIMARLRQKIGEVEGDHSGA
jgi:RNA polymerase sigma-70 factor (ECF subfamily)